MLRVCALLILGILKKQSSFGSCDRRIPKYGKNDFNMRHSRLGRALEGRNSLKIFLIHFFEILTVY